MQKKRKVSTLLFYLIMNKFIHLLQASMNRSRGLSNAQNYLHFLCLIRRISRKELNSYNAGGMTLLQKGF